MSASASHARGTSLAALLSTTSVIALLSIGAGAAQGQTPPNQQVAQAANTEVPEQVLVTGSLIQGAQAVGVPVSDVRPVDLIGQTDCHRSSEDYSSPPH